MKENIIRKYADILAAWAVAVLWALGVVAIYASYNSSLDPDYVFFETISCTVDISYYVDIEFFPENSVHLQPCSTVMVTGNHDSLHIWDCRVYPEHVLDIHPLCTC